MNFLTLEFKVEDLDESKDKAIIKGYASTFGNIDRGFDIVEKGAFTKTIKEAGIHWPILDQHDYKVQLGWNLEGKEDGNGLKVVGELDLKIQKSVERYSLAQTAKKIGAPMGLSIGYRAIKAEPDKDRPIVRRLKELQMFEYSFATFPMNVEAGLTDVKSLVGRDRLNFIVGQLQDSGLTLDEIKEALLATGAAKDETDPNQLIQSLQKLNDSIKSATNINF